MFCCSIQLMQKIKKKKNRQRESLVCFKKPRYFGLVVGCVRQSSTVLFSLVFLSLRIHQSSSSLRILLPRASRRFKRSLSSIMLRNCVFGLKSYNPEACHGFQSLGVCLCLNAELQPEL